MDEYEYNALIFKALAEPKRLKILDLLSSGEMCACELLEYFKFAQPTLSHHMKVLNDCGLVEIRKEGKWNHYKLNNRSLNNSILYYLQLITETEEKSF